MLVQADEGLPFQVFNGDGRPVIKRMALIDDGFDASAIDFLLEKGI